MQTPQRQCQPGLNARLVDEPWRFSFTAAVALLVRWLVRRGVPREQALADVLRFENSVTLGFPGSEVEALRLEMGQEGVRIVLTPTCFGLLGSGGTLPLHDTDRCGHAATRGDPAARAYMDSFSTRMTALFWQAWALPRMELAPDAAGDDPARELLDNLAGRRSAEPDEGTWFAGLARMRPVSTATLERIVGGALGLPVSVESLSGFWDVIEPAQRSVLGGANPVLGASFLLGTSVWRVDRRLRIVIGPLERADFDRMLPDGAGAAQLRGLLKLASAQSLLDFEICLLPSTACIPAMTLSVKPGAMPRLGYDTVLAGDPPERREIRYLLDLRTGDAPCP